jgi:hypothetical protein
LSCFCSWIESFLVQETRDLSLGLLKLIKESLFLSHFGLHDFLRKSVLNSLKLLLLSLGIFFGNNGNLSDVFFLIFDKPNGEILRVILIVESIVGLVYYFFPVFLSQHLFTYSNYLCNFIVVEILFWFLVRFLEFPFDLLFVFWVSFSLGFLFCLR